MLFALHSGWAFELVPTTNEEILALDPLIKKL